MTAWPERLLGVAAAIAGLAGVGLSALAAHSGAGPSLDVAARFLLVHGATLVGLVGLIASGPANPRIGRLAGGLMVLGLVLFCGDLVCRAFPAVPRLPMVAPTGGLLLMLGWAALGLAMLTRAARPDRLGPVRAEPKPVGRLDSEPLSRRPATRDA